MPGFSNDEDVYGKSVRLSARPSATPSIVSKRGRGMRSSPSSIAVYSLFLMLRMVDGGQPCPGIVQRGRPPAKTAELRRGLRRQWMAPRRDPVYK